MMPAVQEFGIAFESPSVRDFIAAAKVAEALGFGTFWVPEDPVFPGAFATASAIASNTTKIKSASVCSTPGPAIRSRRRWS
jgi:alkanesulfonate monooxygenase SsuD/methylene tetrahydromethanopterin reductase-like flavin-dependent oxidoreductase (luciferase family)